MAKAETSPTSDPWPAEGLPIGTALSRLRSTLWGAHEEARRAAAKDLADREKERAHGYKGALSPKPDVTRRLGDHERATSALLVELRTLLERDGYELWAQLGSPFEDPQRISPSALGELTAIDFKASKAEGAGMPLFDLRLRAKRANAADDPKIWITNEFKAMQRAGQLPARIRPCAQELHRRMLLAAKTLPLRVLEWRTIENRLRDWQLWPPGLAK